MKLRKTAATLTAVALTLAACAAAFADTIRLRDGSVIRGQIIAYKDQQFTVLVGGGARGRRGRMTVYMEDVESIEFDLNTGAADSSGSTGSRTGGEEATYDMPDDAAAQRTPSGRTTQPPASSGRPAPTPQRTTTQPDAGRAPATGSSAPVFFPIRLRVDPKSTESGWISSGFTVRRGQRLRVTASGRITLSSGVATTPTGLPRVADAEKLLPNEPTGALIAVIGDDNNDFILLSSEREFTAQRDGILFLGINTGRLTSTSGAFDVLIEAEAAPRAE